MTKNPLETDEDGVPKCYGRCDENDVVCSEDCPSDLKEKCENETESDHVRNPEDLDLDGKPKCFSKEYSDYSSLCQEDCGFLTSCKRTTKELATWFTEAKRDAERDKLKVHLPVLNNNPIPTIVSPFSNPTPQPMQPINRAPPVQYWDNANKGYPYQTPYTSPTPQIGVTQNRPNLSQEQYLAYYGVLPAPNPLVAGQFEGETWYSRLLKEWILQSCMHAVQVAGQLVISAIGRVRWAPKQ